MNEKWVYEFAKHCLTDKEFNRGGIPTKELYYRKKLNWRNDCLKLKLFYEAVCQLYDLQREVDNG